MKKYLVLSIVLSIIIILPVVYPKWSKMRREKQIAETIKKARQVQGTALSDILENNVPAKNHITILYTGNTQSDLEPCGCYVGQSGGVARRATVIERLKKASFSPLILDAGEIFYGESKLDRLKSEVYLKAMNMMGYDAACISASEFRFGKAYLKEQIQQSNFPFLSANLKKQENKEIEALPYIIKNVGQFKVAIIGISNIFKSTDVSNFGSIGKEPVATLKHYVPILNEEADFLILLSNLAISETRKIAEEVTGIDVIISSQNSETEYVKDTLIAYCDAQGKTMGMLSLSLNLKGNIVSNTVKRITMQEEIPDKPEVIKLIENFYHQVANTPDFWDTNKRLFIEDALEQEKDNGYIGTSGCTTCHSEEYEQWLTTSHAVSFNTLLAVQKHFYPDCVVCHVTGFGYKTGYKIDQPKEEFKSVSCETCHGPGKEHSFAPTKENIRGKVPLSICAHCHTEEHSPGFMKVAHLAIPMVNHSQKRVSIKEILERRINSPVMPTIDLFVMSYCPFGAAAEEKLIPILKEFKDKVNFNLYFIAEENKEEKASGTRGSLSSSQGSSASRFKSLHGQAEVIEDIRQVVIAKYYKDKLFDYLEERNKNLKKNWEDCAKKLQIDKGRVKKLAGSEEGAMLFLDNIKKSQELNIKASPTIMIDSIKLKSNILYTTGAKGGLCGP